MRKISDNNNNILYSSQREIKAVFRPFTLTHNEEYISVIQSHETHTHTHTYTLLDIHPLSLNQYDGFLILT